MCGICGKLNFDGEPVAEDLVRRMTATLVHRGPDDSGVHLAGSLGLGHQRLSIIDLSQAGHQPMRNPDGSLWIVFNGEIYNFPDLRRGLEERGHQFRSDSDTEVILHLYEEEGPRCLEKLRGIFALAIWDEKKKRLFLARDRIGKKPLFYYDDGRRLLFASEIKGILADESVPREPDRTGIHHYLTYQCVPSPFSGFKGIKKLPPAHYLLVENGRTTLHRYWSLPYLPKYEVRTRQQEQDLEAQLLDKFREAVKVRLLSDVPLGAFLSGGVDSSAVVAFMSELMNEPVKTFSIGFKEEKYSELKYAKVVSDLYKTDHTEYIVEPNALEILPKLVWHYNEPFADSSAIPTYYVSKLAREAVTVALNGDGGDENFAGYGRYLANAMGLKISRFFPPALIRFFLPLIKAMPHGQNPQNFFWKVKRFLQELSVSPGRRNGHWICHFNNTMKEEILTPAFRDSVADADSFQLLFDRYGAAEAKDFMDKILYADVSLYLPDDLLVKVDIASMANSLEARSPFLDHEFMEFVARIPARLKLKGRCGKYILKKALRRHLPHEILYREKMGFGVPIDHWFRNDLKEMAYDTILSPRAIGRGYFNKAALTRILDEHVAGKWNWQYQIWNLLVLELWHQMFIDGSLTLKENFAEYFSR